MNKFSSGYAPDYVGFEIPDKVSYELFFKVFTFLRAKRHRKLVYFYSRLPRRSVVTDDLNVIF